WRTVAAISVAAIGSCIVLGIADPPPSTAAPTTTSPLKITRRAYRRNRIRNCARRPWRRTVITWQAIVVWCLIRRRRPEVWRRRIFVRLAIVGWRGIAGWRPIRVGRPVGGRWWAAYIRGSGTIGEKGSDDEQNCRRGGRNEEVAHDISPCYRPRKIVW